MIDYDKERYANGKLMGFVYNVHRFCEIKDRLDVLAIKLSGTIQSPRIKSAEEAKYQSGTRIFHDNKIELMEEERLLTEELIKRIAEIKEVVSFLQKLTEDELELAYELYELHRTYEVIGAFSNQSRSSIWRKREKMLSKW